MVISQQLDAFFDEKMKEYPTKRSFLVPMLLYAQDEIGYLGDAVIAHLAKKTELTELEVRNVISYYSMLRTKPLGKYHVQVCTNISCMLRGGEEILEHCEKRLGIGHKQITQDGFFSLEEVECIGACSWAPAIQVNYDFHENLTPDATDIVLLLLSEVVTNSVMHSLAAETPIEVDASLVGSTVQVVVGDGGGGFAPQPREPSSSGGYGLFLLDAQATRWGIGHHRRTRVWFELDVG